MADQHMHAQDRENNLPKLSSQAIPKKTTARRRLNRDKFTAERGLEKHGFEDNPECKTISAEASPTSTSHGFNVALLDLLREKILVTEADSTSDYTTFDLEPWEYTKELNEIVKYDLGKDIDVCLSKKNSNSPQALLETKQLRSSEDTPSQQVHVDDPPYHGKKKVPNPPGTLPTDTGPGPHGKLSVMPHRIESDHKNDGKKRCNNKRGRG